MALGKLSELWRYYGVGLINTAFGYGLYVLLVYIGLNPYVAQIISHCTGVAFNYFMFRRHVFTNHHVNLGRYVGAYALNYLIGLASLWAWRHLISSPYIAGFLALLTTSMINYFVLRFAVFKRKAEA